MSSFPLLPSSVRHLRHALGVLLGLILLETSPSPRRFARLSPIAAVLIYVAVFAITIPAQTFAPLEAQGRIPAYHPRFERERPVVAVIGENSGTELTDFAIPYGVLARSGVADVFSVSTRPGVLQMRPALKVQPQASIAEFDARFPQGADYVVVPAVVKFNDPTLVAWVKRRKATKEGRS